MSDKPGKCDESTDAKKSEYMAEAQATVGHRLYGATQVLVKGVTGNKISLSVNKDGGTTTGLLELNWGDLEDMWPPCPSSLPSKATPGDFGAPPTSGDGTLYLTEKALSKSTGIVHSAIKFPREWAADDDYYQDVKIWPTRIVVTGLAESSQLSEPQSVDLLDPAMAKPDQSIRTDNHTITVKLTRTGCTEQMGVSFDAEPHLAAAVKVISTERTDPDKIAKAWQIVSLALKQRLAGSHSDNPAKLDEIDALLAKVLSSYKV